MSSAYKSLLNQFALKQFGASVDLTRNPITATVGATATRILGNNPNRISYIVINRSPNACGLGFDQGVDKTSHIVIDGNGGMMTMNVWEDAELVGYEVYAISPLAGATFDIYEVTQ